MTDILDWYFSVSPSLLGVRSSFGGMVAQLQQVAGSGGASEPEYDLEAIALNRRVYAALMTVAPLYRNVLAAAYETTGDRVQGVLRSIGVRGERLELTELYLAAARLLQEARDAFERAYSSS